MFDYDAARGRIPGLLSFRLGMYGYSMAFLTAFNVRRRLLIIVNIGGMRSVAPEVASSSLVAPAIIKTGA